MLLKALNKIAGQGIEQWDSSCSFRLKHKSYLAFTAEVLVWLIVTSSWQKFVATYLFWAALQGVKSKKVKNVRDGAFVSLKDAKPSV